MYSRVIYEDCVYFACKAIVDSLEDENVSRVILVGEAGNGKTWMARKVCERMACKDGSFYISLWLNLNKDFDETSLYEDIASQLSLVPENEGSEEDDTDNENCEDEEEQENRYLIRLKDQIQQKLRKKKLKAEGKKYLLLVLDDEGSVTKEETVMKHLHLEDFLVRGKDRPLKILLTRRKGEEDATNSDREIQSHTTVESNAYSDEEIKSHSTDLAHTSLESYSEMEPLPTNVLHASRESHTIPTKDMSDVLHESNSNPNLQNLFKFLIRDELLESLEKSSKHWSYILLDRSMHLPAAVVVLAKSLNCIAPKRSLCFSKDVHKLVDLLNLPDFDFQGHDDGFLYRRNPVLQLAYEILKTDDTMTRSIVDCFWHSLSFFEHCGCVYYQELIAHWILEGYFDPVRSVTEAYEHGHVILMELINRGFLKIQEDNMVMPEVAMKNVIDPGRLGRSRLGLYTVYSGKKKGGLEKKKKEGLGKIHKVDDMIEGVRVTRNKEKITTILVGGNHLRRDTPEKFFEKLKDLEVLGLFKPTLTSFVPSLSKLVNLRILVIRNCDLLKDIEELKALQWMCALEVSGASSLTQISDDFFAAIPDLQSLHLSKLQIKSSPSSISKLQKLRCLIIKDCPILEDLPDIQELVNLEVVDVSGGRRLQTCFDKEKGEKRDKSKNRNFCHLQRLQLLDFSESQIERLPMFQDSALAAGLHFLTQLLLRNCTKLVKLPSLKPLSGLQILDLSGTKSLAKIMEVCFEDKKELRSLNLSGSNLHQLPYTIEELSNLNELLLGDCTNLEVLPNIIKLTNLMVIDASGCTKLHTIEGSFEDMFYLREVNLSGTKVTITPDFLPSEDRINIRCPKRFTQADGRVFEGDKWSDVRKAMMHKKISDKASSSEIRENESEEIGEISPNEPHTTDCTGKGEGSTERLLQVPIDCDLYKEASSSLDTENQEEVMKIHANIDIGADALANADFVSFVDISSTRLTSVFNGTKSVKGCWLKMCKDIEYLFSGVDEKRLGSLENLSITNLPLFGGICSRGFKNLKTLNVDCCPNIKTLFSYPSQLPSSLEVLHIKFCENLEKVFKEGKVPTLTTLCLHELPVLSTVGAKLPNLETFKAKNCPNLEKMFEDEGEISTLTTLCLHDLHVLSNVGAKLPNLKTLKAKNCPNLEIVFEDEGEISTLTTLCLHGLPVLSTVGSKLPNLETFKAKNCPNLEKMFEEKGEISTLTTLGHHDLPVLSDIRAKLPNLKKVKLENCPKFSYKVSVVDVVSEVA